MNTAELINNLLDRADGSLDHLKFHYGPLIRYVITPILHDERDREEVFSDILISVWDLIDQYDPNSGSWTNWLSTIARNAAIDRVRRNPRRCSNRAGTAALERTGGMSGSSEKEVRE